MLVLISMCLSYMVLRAWEEASSQAGNEIRHARQRLDAHIENQRSRARERLRKMRAKGPRSWAWWGWLGITTVRFTGATAAKAAKGTVKSGAAAGRVTRAGTRGALRGFGEWRDWREQRRQQGGGGPQQTGDGDNTTPGEPDPDPETDGGYDETTTCPACGEQTPRQLLIHVDSDTTRCIVCYPAVGEANCRACQRRHPIDDLTAGLCPSCHTGTRLRATTETDPGVVDAEIIHDPEDPSTWGRIETSDPAQPGITAGPDPDTGKGDTEPMTTEGVDQNALAQNEGGEMGIEDTRLIYDQINDQMSKLGDLVQRLTTSLHQYEASQEDIKDATNVMEAANILATAAQTARSNHDARNAMTEQAAVEETHAVRNTDYHRRGK